MKLRRVNPKKWRTELNELQAACFPEDTPCAYLPADLWWIAFDGDKPIGFCATRPVTHFPDVWILCRAGVLESHRGHGIQKKMIRARVSAAKKRGATCIVSNTIVENVASSNSLIAAGFKVFQPTVKWAAPDVNYWRLML